MMLRAGRTTVFAPTARRKATSRTMGLLLCLLWTVLPTAATAANVDAIWNGGASNWNNISNWSGAVVPNNGGGNTFSVFIDGGKATNSLVTLDISPTITNLTINSGDQLSQGNGLGFGLAGGTMTNNGAYSMNSTGANTDLNCLGAATLSGTGSIGMNNNTANRLITDNTVCQQGAGHTIHGAGQLLVNTGGMQNAGTISADQPSILSIFPNGKGVANTGILQATSGGTLLLQNGTFTNTGGLVRALDMSTVRISAATLVDGTMTSVGTGSVSAEGNATFTNVTNTGAAAQVNGQPATVTGTLTNNGTWSLNSTGASTDLACVGGATLAGSGNIVMSNNVNNRILTNNTVCTNAAMHMIHGAGQLLVNTGGMLNNGTIVADQAAGLTIFPNGNGFTNTGTLQATSGGTLTLQNGLFTNTNGLIEAADLSMLSTVLVNAATVVDGTLTTSGMGTISAQGGATFMDVTNSGAVVQPNGQSAAVMGMLTNNGSWSLSSSGANTDLICKGAATLAGDGSIFMSDNPVNRIVTDNTVCTNGVGHTIRGAGQLLVNTGGMVNNGTVLADRSSGLTIFPNGKRFVNNASLRAASGATLTLLAGSFDNGSGVIEAMNGSQVLVGNATVTGGHITSIAGDPTSVVSLASPLLVGVTSTAAIKQGNGNSATINGTIVNDSTWALNSTGANTDLNCLGGATLSGMGTVVMSDNVANRLITDNTVCTNAATHTIHGAGQLLVNTGGMKNDGTISADKTSILSIFPNGKGVTNTGTLQARTGGTLLLQNGTFTNTNALIKAFDASTVRVNAATLVDGTITTIGSGVISAENGATFTNVTNTGAIAQANGQPAAVTQTLTNNGTWSMTSSGANTDLDCIGGATLAGTGSIAMSNNVANRLVTDNTVCQNAAGHTIHGAGQLLVNTGGMQNAGTITADQASSLTIFPNGKGFINTGTVQATAGGTLVLQSGTFTNTGGLIQASDPSIVSTVAVTAATVVDGTMTTSGVGTINVAGGATFTNVTNTGAVAQANGQPTTVTGTLTNNGTWSLNSTGANTDLTCFGGATLAGSGSIAMTNNTANRILTNNTVCTNAAPHTIHGAGQLLVNTGGMVNKGTITADQTTGLTIFPNGNGFTNQGTVHAKGSGGISMPGGPVTNAGTVLVDAASSLSRSGAYPQTAGATTVNGTLSATGLGDIQGGVLQGAGTVVANVSNAGQVNPGTGTSPGLLTINGTYTQLAGGAFNIEIGGPTVGTDYDRLAVSGMATLAGTINISLASNFKPTVGSMFTILTFTSHAGDFATYNGLTQSNGVVFSKMFTPSALILEVVGETSTATPTTTAALSPTATSTITSTVAPSATPTRTRTVVVTATATATSSPVSTATPTSSPTTAATATPTLTPTTTGAPTATATATTTRMQTASVTPTNTATASPTPTPTLAITPGMVALFGRVLSPGIGGFPGSHGQVPIGDARVDLFLCPVRTPCLGTGDPVTSVFTQPDGRFVILVPAAFLENKLPVVVARITATVAFRAPVIALPASAASARAARQVSGTGAIVDAISEAAVRLLNEAGFENFTVDGIAAVVQAVETANADANFEVLTPEQAANAATGTAAADPNVQIALEDNKLPTPTPTSTPPTIACVGDCNGSGEVTVDEVIKGVNIALDNAPLDTCPEFDLDGNGEVAVTELIIAVNNVLDGCQ